MTHDREQGASAVAVIERVMETHLGHLIRRINALKASLQELFRIVPELCRTHSSQAVPQEDMMLSPCATVSKLEELDRSRARQEEEPKTGGTKCNTSLKLLEEQT